MKAALIITYADPPTFTDVADPVPTDDEVLVRVRAAAVHQLVRARATGRHYSVAGILPAIPGVDGTGELADGSPVYFQSMAEGRGSLAELVAVPRNAVTPLPPGADPVAVAAGVNPCLAAWMSLTARAALQPGERVVVLGATGASGSLTVAAARILGASHITAVGRNRAALDALDADARLCLLDDDPAAWTQTFRDADVVVDLLWGDAAERAFAALVAAHRPAGHPLRYVEVGTMAGTDASIPGGVFRSSDVRLLGSGFGAFTTADLERELPRMLAALADGRLAVDHVAAPLAEVEAEWATTRPERLVLLP